MKISEAMAHFESKLISEGFETSLPSGNQEYPVESDLYARRSLRAGPFPAEDHFFLHDMTGRNSGPAIKELHDRARAWVNSLQRMPRMMRLKVPCIVSIGIAEPGFDAEALRAVMDYPQKPLVGGEVNCLYLVDLSQKKLISRGMSTTSVDGMNFKFPKIDPINRSLILVQNITTSLFA